MRAKPGVQRCQFRGFHAQLVAVFRAIRWFWAAAIFGGK